MHYDFKASSIPPFCFQKCSFILTCDFSFRKDITMPSEIRLYASYRPGVKTDRFVSKRVFDLSMLLLLWYVIVGLCPINRGPLPAKNCRQKIRCVKMLFFVTIPNSHIFVDINRSEFAFALIDSAESQLSNGAKTTSIR